MISDDNVLWLLLFLYPTLPLPTPVPRPPHGTHVKLFLRSLLPVPFLLTLHSPYNHWQLIIAFAPRYELYQ